MSKQKNRSSKAKKQAKSSATTDLIPPEIRELLGPSPVVDIAEEPIFERMLAGAVAELRPSGMIEWTLVHDFVVTTWEIRQLREYKTSFLQVEHVKYCTYRAEIELTEDQKKEVKEATEYVRDAADPELTKEQNFRYFNDRWLEILNRMKPAETHTENRKLTNLSVGETRYKRAIRFSQVIVNQAGTLDHLQKMTLMLEKRRDSLLRDLDRRQIARRERETAQLHRDQNATDIETRVEG